jgi:2-phospho-L-lactate guanylyltransferase
VLAIVPVKDLEGAKSRLAPLLAPAERRALALAMLDRVLAACAEADAVHSALVVTPDPSLAVGHDVLVDEGVGHAPAVAAALADPRAAGGALVVMADCPLASAASLDALVEAARPLALVAAQDGGVNAFALRDPRSFAPVLGVPGAATLTVARARAAGLDLAVVDDPLLAFDVDLPEDLVRFEEQRGICAG